MTIRVSRQLSLAGPTQTEVVKGKESESANTI
jgi:hypothetical protein